MKLCQIVVRAALLGALGLLFGCQVPHGPSGGDDSLLFIQMADPQFGMTTRNENFAAETELFEAAIDEANRLQPSFVVVCGDMINRPGDAEQTAELMRIADQLDDAVPLHWVVGNHEIGNEPTPESLAWYRETFGPDWYAFDLAGCHFIVLNSTLLQQPETLPDDAVRQMEWLRRELEESERAGAAQTIVFMHHPVCLTDRDEEDGYFVLPTSERLPFLDLLHTHGVDAVFSGHYHRNAFVLDGDLELVTTGPVGKPLGDDPSGFRLVWIQGDRLRHEYHALERAPAGAARP